MELPESLPARMFLLAWLPEKRRVSGGGNLGLVLRAAALTDLYLSGALADEGGKPHVTARADPADPLLAEVLRQIREEPPRSWRRWVEKGNRAATGQIRDQLAAGGRIRVERHTALGVFRAYRVTVRDPLMAKRLVADTARLLSGSGALADVDPRAAATAALAATGGIPTVGGWRERHRQRARIAALADRSGPAVPALRRAIQSRQAASSGG